MRHYVACLPMSLPQNGLYGVYKRRTKKVHSLMRTCVHACTQQRINTGHFNWWSWQVMPNHIFPHPCQNNKFFPTHIPRPIPPLPVHTKHENIKLYPQFIPSSSLFLFPTSLTPTQNTYSFRNHSLVSSFVSQSLSLPTSSSQWNHTQAKGWP